MQQLLISAKERLVEIFEMTQKGKFINSNNMIHLTDSHCHLDMEDFSSDLNGVLLRAAQNDVKSIVAIGIDLESSRKAVELSLEHRNVFATIGYHPHYVSKLNESTYEELELLYKKHRNHIVGYGEIGLDYAKARAPRKIQIQHFREQLLLARELQLPVIIHSREAREDCLAILEECKPYHHGGIFHCFSEDINFANHVIDMGFLISIPGIVTFRNAKTLREVVQKTDLSKLVLETDAPFLAPEPHRGMRNEPSFLRITAEKIADLKNTTLEQVAQETTRNLNNIFKLQHEDFNDR